MSALTHKASVYVAFTVLTGLTVLGIGLSQWHTDDLTRFICYFTLAVLATGLKVSLPTFTGTLSVNFLFIMIALVELSLSETLALGGAAALVGTIWQTEARPQIQRVLFNIAVMSLAVVAADFSYHHPYLREHGYGDASMVVVAAIAFFVASSLPVTLLIAMVEGKTLRSTWGETYLWSFPYYVAGAAIAALYNSVNNLVGWQTSMLLLPVIYLIYRSYRLYLGRLDDGKQHAEEIAALHLRTIEALALAIEAKDMTTHDHLQRVQIYALGVAKELNLGDQEIEALRAASLLRSSSAR